MDVLKGTIVMEKEKIRMRNIINLFALILTMTLIFSCHRVYNKRKNLLYSENNRNIDSIYVANENGIGIAKFTVKKGVKSKKISLTNFSPDIYDCDLGCPFVLKPNSVYVFVIINKNTKAIKITTDSVGEVKLVKTLKMLE